MRDLSIIVVNWNAVGHLVTCLSSVSEALAANHGLSGEIIVVDNASTDGSALAVERRFPLVRLLKNETNRGFASANNQAMQVAEGKYLLLLNPDTAMQTNTLRELVDFMEANPQAGAAGPRILNPDGSLQPSCSPSPSLLRELWRLSHLDRISPYGIYDMTSWELDRDREVEVLMGACIFLRRQALNKVGMLDEDFFVYTEEVDLCYRLRRAGWKLFWIPSAQLVHYGGQSTRQVAEAMFLQLYRSKVMFFRKHRGWLGATTYKAILFLASVSRLAGAPIVALKKPAERDRIAKLMRNYQRLLRALPTF